MAWAGWPAHFVTEIVEPIAQKLLERRDLDARAIEEAEDQLHTPDRDVSVWLSRHERRLPFGSQTRKHLDGSVGWNEVYRPWVRGG